MRKQKENIFIILIVLIILAISASGIYAWARYQSIIAQKTTMQVAKWSFKVNGQTENFAEINLADTVQSDHIAENRIAPGTQGCFEIELDASGSEVGVKYTVEITEIVDKPANLKFYSDAEFTKEMKIENGSILITGVITLDKINEKVNKNIYWKWAYNTGSTEEEILQNDVLDTQDAGKTTTMKIIVTGEQLEVNEQLETDIIAPTIKWTEELKILSEDDTGTVYQIPLEVVGNGGYTETTLLSNLELDEVHLLLDNNEITPLTKEMTYEETADGKKIYNLNIKLLTWGKLEIKINKDAIIDNSGLKNEEVRFLVVDIDADMLGSGTEEDPYIIYTVKHLNQVRNKLNVCYRLGRNIDLSTEENWVSIGDATTAFSGSFDGDGYSISNLNINVTTNYAGLFGYNKGNVKNLTIENVNISAGQYTGALAGYNEGQIENIIINEGRVVGDTNTGGLIGYNTNEIKNVNTNVNVKGIR